MLCDGCMVTNFRRRSKQKALDYKGGKCLACGYDRAARSLQFHHLDPSKKDFSPGAHGVPRKWSVLIEELKKCVLLCANCHGEAHEGMITLEYLQELEQRRLATVVGA